MLGVDIGTTNIKAALYTYSGEEIFVKSTTYLLYTDKYGAAVQSANQIKEKTFQIIKESTEECKKKNIKISFISFSAAMHSLLGVDENGQSITPVLTWGDRQSEHYLNDLKNEMGSAIYHRTGTPIHSMSPFVKLYWLKNDYPKIIQKTYKFIDVKSFILYQLFGDYFMDYSLANSTGLFNMHTLSWDSEALSLAGVAENKLPQLVPTTKVLKGMKEEVASELGLDLKTPMIIGASDGCLANLGVNAIEQGKVALTIGTSGAIRTVTKRPLTDKHERTFCYALTEDLWVIGGAVNNGGVVLDWAKDRLMKNNDTLASVQIENDCYDLMMQQIEKVQPGADNLFFFPYLMGERSPIWRPDSKGSFIGLDIHHQNEHMLRAVLEGINLNLYAVYTAISEVIEADAKEILVTGGFTQSNIWLKMLADIFGVTFTVTKVSENACLGAVLLGLFALGEIEDFSELDETILIERQIKPDKRLHQFYQSHFEKYQNLNQKYIEMLDIFNQ